MPVPILPGLKNRGDGLAQGGKEKNSDVEVSRWAQEELASKAKEVYPVLLSSGRMLFMVGVLCVCLCVCVCSVLLTSLFCVTSFGA